jgi:hypothetical protein
LVKDPNQLVQQSVALAFTTFRKTGSIRQTFKWFHENAIELPVNKPRDGKFRIVFKLPTLALIHHVLQNPIYAGAYVFGRRPCQVRVVDGALKRGQRSPVALERARVFLRDHHEGYIDWTTYEENQRLMRNNCQRWGHDDGAGAARRGQGLLAGLLRCARCGRRIYVRYWGKSGTAARYLCGGDYMSGGSYCLGFGGGTVDRRVAEEVLRVVAPLGIEASLEAIRQRDGVHDGRRALLEKQLESAEYEARRAFEQYDQVDARNRLVASELEARWNEKLRAVDAARSAIAALEQTPSLSDAERADLRALGTHFRDVWGSPSCTPELKKKIVRTIIEEIIANDEPAGTLCFVIRWTGGMHTRLEMPKPAHAGRESRTAIEDLEVIKRMAVRYGDDQIANVLNRLGRRTGKGKRWNEHRVATARRNHDIAGQARAKLDPDVLSLNGAAQYAKVSDTTIRRLVGAGVLGCEQIAPRAPWEIRRDDLDREPVRGILGRLRATGRLELPVGAADGQRALFPEQTK